MRCLRGVVSICSIGFVLLLAACGGSDVAGTSPRAALSRQGGNALAAPTYVPAPQTCAAMPGPAKIAPSPIASATTHLSGYRVCGPFAATTRLSSFDCPRPSTASGPFRLLVYNGRPDGAGRVSEAEISFNGQKVLREDAFDPHVPSAAASVTLAASNRIVVRLDDEGGKGEQKDHPGPAAARELRVEVVDEGQTCFALRTATVTQTSPLNRQFARLNAFPIPEFQLFPGGGHEHTHTEEGQVSLNGVALLGKHDLREKTSAILTPVSLSASNRITASVRKGSFTAQIVDRDETPPHFNIAAPPDGSFTNRPQLALSGAIDDPSATVTVNGARATLSSGGYSGQVSLAECWNTIAVAAADVCTNAGSAGVRVGLDTVPPVPVVMGPPNGLVTNQPAQPVTLRFSDNFSGIDLPSLQVSLDGQDIRPSLAVSADAATGSLTLPEGRHTIHAQVSDRAGNVTATDSSFIVDLTPPVLSVVAPKDGSTLNQPAVPVSITFSDALSGVDVTSLIVALDGKDVTNRFTVGPASASATLAVAAGAHTLDVRIADLSANLTRARSSFAIADALPPDPRTVATPLDRTVATDIAQATAFLYTGENAIQKGVVPGTIVPSRAAVIRGRVRAIDASPLPGVAITILGHPEYGGTVSRADGMFDLAVNGGALLTVVYAKDGLFPVQRQVQAPQRDYAWIDDVALIAADPEPTSVNLDASGFQVARGRVVTDPAGTRQATLIFTPGTQARMTGPNGSQVLQHATVRATEFTVGLAGRAAMPGELPPNTAYTYAVEYSVDEALQTGATVHFNQPVFAYVENFKRFPVGVSVPSGYYDRSQGQWVASQDGVVLQILGSTGGLADIDLQGKGTAAAPALLQAFGLSDGERQRLAVLYAAGTSLWRVPITHFSAWDFNTGKACKGAICAAAPAAPNSPPPECKQTQPGSIIGCTSQTLGESVDIVGTPFSMHYESDRTPGRKVEYTVEIPITDSVVPDVVAIIVQISVAGRQFQYTLPKTANQTLTFTWDGLDAYGRAVQGRQPLTSRVGYVYELVYVTSAEIASAAASFGMPLGSFGHMTYFGYPVSAGTWTPGVGDPWQEISSGPPTAMTVWRDSKTQIGTWDSRPQGLAGWSLNVHHAYVAESQTVYYGDGSVDSSALRPAIAKIVAGGLWGPRSIAFGPDGALYIQDLNRVLRVGADGLIREVAGTGVCSGYLPTTEGEGGPALSANICPLGIAVGPDGSLYVADFFRNAVLRVGRDGILRRFAGNGTRWPDSAWESGPGISTNLGEGGPALDAQVGRPRALAVAPDGTVYISATQRVLAVSSDGLLRTVAGTGLGIYGYGYFGDGGPAIRAGLFYPAGLAVDRQGNLFIADQINSAVRKVSTDGTITTVAGLGPSGAGFGGDLGPATKANLRIPGGVAVDAEGTLYIADSGNSRVRAVGAAGIIATVMGGGSAQGDGDAAQSVSLYSPEGIAVGPDGSLYVADQSGVVLRRTGVLPSEVGATMIASRDGSEGYQFDFAGRHLKTIDTLTNAVLYQFAYDGNGRLSSVTDRAGNVTTLDRDGAGNLTGIVSPYGQRTAVALDANGFLAQLANPASEISTFAYDGAGLLQTYTDPRSGVHSFAYDEMGRLLKDTDPVGSAKTLSRAGAPDSYAVTLRSPLGRSTTYGVQSSAGGQTFTDTFPDGSQSSLSIATDDSSTRTARDATVFATRSTRDPRFGLQSPLTTASTRSPSGLQLSVSEARTATLGPSGRDLDLANLASTTTINGQTFTSTYDRASSTVTSTTPAGRRAVTTLDSLGRVAQVQAPGVLPLQVRYDSRGRPLSVTQGSRVYSYAYDSLGNLASLTDPLGRSVSLAYDLAGRPTRQVLPDGRAVALAYDASGNVTSVTPPGRPAHSFGYTPVDLRQSYSPPTLGFPSATLTSYNLDQQVSLISRPAGDTVVPSYDSAGRVASVTTSWGTTSLSYSPTTGQLAQITAPDLGKLSYVYDGALLTDASWSGSVSGSIHRTYDNFFRVASESVSGGQAISYKYDIDGLLMSAGALTLQRDPATGFVSGSALGATTESRTYDAYGAEASYTASLGGSNLYSVTYTRDALGRIDSKAERFGAEPSHTFTYSYDVAGRLSDVSKDGAPSTHYAYDANGNRLAGPGLTSSPAYDVQDRLLSYGQCRYTYKADGTLQTKTCPDGTTLYDYDAFGSLRYVTLPSGTSIAYVIDGRNRRIGKKVNGVLVEGFLYRSRLQPVAWLDGAGAVTAQFIYGARTNVPEYMVKGANIYRFVADQVGSVRLVVEVATGQVAERIDYDEFGNVLFDTAPGFQPFGFSGGLSDQQTAFVRLGVRDYDPAVGRWTTKDPELFAARAFSLYEYANGDAINRIDPTGFASITADPNGNPRCEELLQKILEVRNELAERAQELREDPQGLQWDHWTVPHPKYGSVKGHQEAFGNKQRQVRRLLEEWNDSDCRDGPRGLPADAWDLATMRAPQPIPRPRPDPALFEAAAATGAAAATAGYLSTFLQVLPVLLPILAP